MTPETIRKRLDRLEEHLAIRQPGRLFFIGPAPHLPDDYDPKSDELLLFPGAPVGHCSHSGLASVIDLLGQIARKGRRLVQEPTP